MQSCTRSPMELWEGIQAFSCQTRASAWERKVARAGGGNRFDPSPRCDQPSQGWRILSKDRRMAKMTLINSCVLYQPEGESAGGASTFHVPDM